MSRFWLIINQDTWNGDNFDLYIERFKITSFAHLRSVYLHLSGNAP